LRSIRPTALLGALLVITACDSGTLETDEQKASYGIGRQLGENLAVRLDVDALLRGIEDARAGRETAVSDEEMAQVMPRLQQAIQEDQMAESRAFLAENAEKDGVTTTESGLQYEVLAEGEGATPQPGDQVTIQYRGTLVDGTEFDSSYGSGEPATFGVSGVIQGFSEGLQLMSVGSKYKLVIPSDLGYGPQGSGQAIGPNETLIFEVELLSIG
jgi:FKBP-type peptidyl-prolyl cis-trans isomerase